MAETEDLKSFQYRFESDWGHTALDVPFILRIEGYRALRCSQSYR